MKGEERRGEEGSSYFALGRKKVKSAPMPLIPPLDLSPCWCIKDYHKYQLVAS